MAQPPPPSAESTYAVMVVAVLQAAGRMLPSRTVTLAVIHALDMEDPTAWGMAVKRLRIMGIMAESADFKEWGPGPQIGLMDTRGTEQEALARAALLILGVALP